MFLYMKILKQLKSYCTPAQLYLGLSLISIISMIIQNLQNPNTYCCGSFKVETPINKVFYFVFKFLYVAVWTYILNILCKKGYSKLSWILVLLPLIMMFVMISIIFLFLKNYR